jgi:hypothetical protein
MSQNPKIILRVVETPLYDGHLDRLSFFHTDAPPLSSDPYGRRI